MTDPMIIRAPENTKDEGNVDIIYKGHSIRNWKHRGQDNNEHAVTKDFPFQYYLKDLDSSYKTNLGFQDRFGRDPHPLCGRGCGKSTQQFPSHNGIENYSSTLQ